MPKTTITIEIEVKSPIEKAEIEQSVKAFAALEFEDRNRIGQILRTPKAIKAIRDNWSLLKLKFS